VSSCTTERIGALDVPRSYPLRIEASPVLTPSPFAVHCAVARLTENVIPALKGR